MSRYVAGLIALVVAATVSAAGAQDAVVSWFRAQAIPIQTPEAGHGFDDLQPLKKVVGNARIVALGEATHGTREFFQLKHRLLEFLATEMGFTIFSIEANMPEAYRLNDYVLTGTGDPKQLLRGMYFWTWDTEEVLDMILWMRRFNESGQGRVEFTGFDMQTPTVAVSNVRTFIAAREPSYSPTIAEAAELSRLASTASGPAFGVANGTFPLAAAAGKRVRFSGYIKTAGITRGYAGLWWRVDGPNGTLAFDNMRDRGATGSTDWKLYDLQLTVPADAKNINFGVLLTGDGAAWFDDLAVELDGVPFADANLFDFQFESPLPKGFATAGNGYGIGIDAAVFRSGKQSLHMRSVSASAPEPPRNTAQPAATAWAAIVSHLDQNRAAYRAAGAADREIEWTLQNARVVLQGLQMRTNQATRNRSMAENIKWIVDRSPDAKVVLWAHNGHVSAGGFAFETMGKTLRKIYGDAMVVMGFAFNQGSFQATEAGTLKTFTVPPAPAGSLDATLAATGLPLLAIDLRTAPKTGPVATWLTEPHASRNIGATFSDATAASYLLPMKVQEHFDVLLFVEKTTAARKN